MITDLSNELFLIFISENVQKQFAFTWEGQQYTFSCIRTMLTLLLSATHIVINGGDPICLNIPQTPNQICTGKLKSVLSQAYSIYFLPPL